MEQLEEGKALNNTPSSMLNAAEDLFYPSGTKTTSHIDEFTNLGNLAGPEFQSIYVPTGGAETEREAHSKSMSPYMAAIDMEGIHASRMKAVAARIGAVEHQWNTSMGPNSEPWSGLEPQTLAEVQKYANNKLPERFQAKDANGKPLVPATIDNGFQYAGSGQGSMSQAQPREPVNAHPPVGSKIKVEGGTLERVN